ncbi:MAG: hypothetical protein J6N76_03985 [Lachnospiraceae bacterium]|nr:hypothetical protein [Lachnospiraceae bacterium]
MENEKLKETILINIKDANTLINKAAESGDLETLERAEADLAKWIDKAEELGMDPF